ncbi:MAG: LuxR C-terminal-related transcriptional regulator [Muribaculaceae bacterium]|nr:LuxR C-terminal-related transcriptional regulator [Muribaculaceae bacterium]
MATKKRLYRNPLILILAAFIAISTGIACSHSRQYSRNLSEAERIVDDYPDSALAILEFIDPVELTEDSLKAQYYYVLASAHDRESQIALSDSMISFADNYYRGKDLKRSIRTATLLASYKFRIGDRVSALRMLDSLLALKNVPDSLVIGPLRNRVVLWAYEGDNRARIKRLIAIDKDKDWQSQYRFWLYFSYIFYDKPDSALLIMNDLMDKAFKEGDNKLYNQYRYEKIEALMELGRYQEVLNISDTLLNLHSEDSGAPYIRLWKSLGLLNMRKHSEAATELAMADSMAKELDYESHAYFTTFATVLHTVLDYHDTGKLSLMPFARVNNPQRDNLFNEQSMRQEAARQALETENQRLIIKAKSDRQTSLLIIVILGALLISGGLVWYAFNKRHKALEVLERNEILQKLVDESKSSQDDSSVNETLRRAMLQQLGIIKMVAEMPTEQNRDMLRKISSVEKGDDSSLVNWQNVYEIIDNLYSDFYSRLHNSHGDTLTRKEEQIIVLMVAGFSTKEISVITGQTVATIYVRKSSVRKKLGVPEKEDIVDFLHRENRN